MDEAILKTWNATNERLYNFVNQQVKDAELAKDIVQDVFIKVFSKIDTLKNKDKIVSWIFQITRNEIVSHYRKHRHQTSSEHLPEPATLEEDMTKEFADCIIPMMASLPEKYREAVQLSEIENMPQKELAQKLGISYSGAKSRVQRGREALKALLEDCCSISTDQYGNVIDYHEKDCSGDCD